MCGSRAWWYPDGFVRGEILICILKRKFSPGRKCVTRGCIFIDSSLISASSFFGGFRHGVLVGMDCFSWRRWRGGVGGFVLGRFCVCYSIHQVYPCVQLEAGPVLGFVFPFSSFFLLPHVYRRPRLGKEIAYGI